MRAFGGPEVLVPAEVPEPVAEPGWVTVQLKAAALNNHDALTREGRYGSPLPHIIGSDGAGIRADTGEEVLIMPSLWWGERSEAPGPRFEILGDHTAGTYAEQIRVPTECVAPKPAHLDWHEAAALPLVGLTAYRALFTRGVLAPGESVLLLGAGSGLVTMALLLARAAGAHVVVTSSADAKIARSMELGAAGGVRYTEQGWADRARTLSLTGEGFDLVFDPVGATWPDSLAAARPGGRVVVMGATAGDRAELDVRRFYFGQHSLLGTTMGSPVDFAGLLAMVEANSSIRPVVDEVFPLPQAADAHRRLAERRGFGKLVLHIS